MESVIDKNSYLQTTVAARHTVGQRWHNEANGKNYIYVHADGAIVANDYCDIDPSSFEAKKCWGNKHQSGILAVARVAFADNEYGFLEDLTGRKAMYEGFDKSGIAYGTSVTGVPTGTAGDENFYLTGNGNLMEFHILGTQTLVYPNESPKGSSGYLDIAQDATADDGAEWTFGILATDKLAFKVGEDGAFHARMKVTIEDVSGTDDFVFGFRKAEAYQAAVDDYDEMAALQIVSTAINNHSILNGGATDNTDTTDTVADTVAFTLEVRVSAAGVVTYLIDGAAPTVATAFTFDDGEVVVPFLFVLNHTDLHGYIKISEIEVGLD
jgi:hypothetical protein